MYPTSTSRACLLCGNVEALFISNLRNCVVSSAYLAKVPPGYTPQDPRHRGTVCIGHLQWPMYTSLQTVANQRIRPPARSRGAGRPQMRKSARTQCGTRSRIFASWPITTSLAENSWLRPLQHTISSSSFYENQTWYSSLHCHGSSGIPAGGVTQCVMTSMLCRMT